MTLKRPTSTNRKKTWKKTDLEKLFNPKSPLDSQKKSDKLTPQDTTQSIKHPNP